MRAQKISIEEVYRRIDESLLKKLAEVYGKGFEVGAIRFSRVERIRQAVKDSPILRSSPFLMHTAKGVYQSILKLYKR